MTIEPNDLAAIKASVAAALVSEFGGEGNPVILKYAPIIDAIDRGAADAAARDVIMFDCETGDEIQPYGGATGTIRQRMAAQLLPGWPEEEIDRAYSAWMEADGSPEPFAVGTIVTHLEAPTLRGKVTKRVESAEGELHTVWVKWEGMYEENTPMAPQPYSPRELREVTD